MVLLNEWNSITVYRHRWDAWILLNEGSRVQGRSKVNSAPLINSIMSAESLTKQRNALERAFNGVIYRNNICTSLTLDESSVNQEQCLLDGDNREWELALLLCNISNDLDLAKASKDPIYLKHIYIYTNKYCNRIMRLSNWVLDRCTYVYFVKPLHTFDYLATHHKPFQFVPIYM